MTRLLATLALLCAVAIGQEWKDVVTQTVVPHFVDPSHAHVVTFPGCPNVVIQSVTNWSWRPSPLHTLSAPVAHRWDPVTCKLYFTPGGFLHPSHNRGMVVIEWKDASGAVQTSIRHY